MSASARLHAVDSLPGHLVWRGDRLAVPAEAGIPSGFPDLDACLPGGGWPNAALSELLIPRPGIGELGLLLPLLARTAEDHWSVCIAPPLHPYAPALAAGGVPLGRILFVQTESPAHARWAARQALASRSCTAVLMWLAGTDMAALRRLQLASEDSATPLFLIRPEHCATQASPAVLRLALRPRVGGVEIRILKRRGPLFAGTLALELPGPVPPRPRPHALVRPLPARSGPPGLRAGAC